MRIFIAKIAVTILLVFFWTWLFLQFAQLDGERDFVWRPGETNVWLHSPLPSDRLGAIQSDGRGAFVDVIDEPLYFSVTPPYGDFDTAKVEVTFLEGEALLFELGALKDLFAQAYDLVPMFHAGLLEATGELIELPDGGRAVYIPDRNESLADAIASEVSPARVTTYRTHWPVPYKESARMALNRFYTSSVVFAGAHEAYVYAQEGSFRLEVNVLDENLVFGQDDVVVSLIDSQGTVVAATVLADDGNIFDDGQFSDERRLVLSAIDLAEGVYRLVFTATSDIRFSEYEITIGKLAFKNRLHIELDNRTDIFTTARSVVIEPLSANALGAVYFGGETLLLERVGEKYEVTLTDGLLSLPGGSARVTGDGSFSLHERSLFSPQSPSLGARLLDDVPGAIFARLPQVYLSDIGVRTSEASWSLASLTQERGAYKFILSVPNASQYENSLRLYEIRVTLTSDLRGFDRFIFMSKQFIKQIFGI